VSDDTTSGTVLRGLIESTYKNCNTKIYESKIKMLTIEASRMKYVIVAMNKTKCQ